MGMLHESMRARLVARGAENFRLYADLAVAHEERVWSSKGTRNTVLRMPAGPAVVITPWNAPFMLSTWKLAPALAAGNTVILKPAEWSPLSCSLLADLTVEAGLPPGVFNLVQGIGEEVGPPLVGDHRVKRISFTGSPETARHIGRAAAENIVPFTAELGGKGPLIVFADADLDAAATKAAGQYDDSGQVCLAGTRLLVAAEVRDEFLARFDAAVDRHVLGDSRDPATTIAPMIHPDHVARVLGFVERAREHGDRIVRGGHRLGDSLHVEPTLIEPASNDSEVVQHEVFGPVLTLQTFTDEAAGRRARQLDAVRPVGHRLHVVAGARRARRAGDPQRDRLGQHVPRARPHGTVRRHRHLRDRPRGRRLRPRLPQRPQDPPDPRGLHVLTTRVRGAARVREAVQALIRYSGGTGYSGGSGLRRSSARPRRGRGRRARRTAGRSPRRAAAPGATARR